MPENNLLNVQLNDGVAGLPASKTRLRSPQWTPLAKLINEFATAMKPMAFPEITRKDIEHFCTLKVQGSLRDGFYLLVALFLFKLEEDGEFKKSVYAPHIPTSEQRLGEMIANYVARKCNDEARSKGDPLPFDIKSVRPMSEYPEVQFRYVFERTDAEGCRILFEDFKSIVDGNAHFIVYRSRLSVPTELMKSFLVIKPFKQSKINERLHHQRTLHIYQTPEDLGTAYRAAPGQVIPLDRGMYILGGQHAEQMRSKDDPRREDRPFRGVELIYLPWTSLQESHLYTGLMFASNSEGTPLVCRICVRPTLIPDTGEFELGSVKLDALPNALAADKERELAYSEKIAMGADDVKRFFGVYEEFKGIDKLAARIANACNNHPQGWGIPPGLVDKAAQPLRHNEAALRIDNAFDGIQSGNGVAFEFWKHIRFVPLVKV